MNTLAFGLPGGLEWIIVGLVALLIFGRRLPDVARSLGKSIVEFKKGIKDVKDDVDIQSRLDAPTKPPLESKPRDRAESPPTDSDEGSRAESSPASTEK